MVAVGGGVAGDLTGFAASTYMRGIDFIQVPTTLLSAVDSSVGGKTAIDLAEAKIFTGTFYQPKAVFININFLNTLDKRQFMSVLARCLSTLLLKITVDIKLLYIYLNFLLSDVKRLCRKSL